MLSLISSLVSSVERLVLFALHVGRIPRWTPPFPGGDWRTPGNTGPCYLHCWYHLCEEEWERGRPVQGQRRVGEEL